MDAHSSGPFEKYGEELSSVRVSVPEEGYQTRYSIMLPHSTVQYSTVQCLTRTTTLVTVDTGDRVTVVEQNHTPAGTRTEIQFTF